MEEWKHDEKLYIIVIISVSFTSGSVKINLSKCELTPEWKHTILFWTHPGSELKNKGGWKWDNICIIIHAVHIYFYITDSDSPLSAQTLYGCTIYETAQNPDGLSLLPLPVKAQHENLNETTRAPTQSFLFQITQCLTNHF